MNDVQVLQKIKAYKAISPLAVHGGQKIRTKKFPPYLLIDQEVEDAVSKVLRSGVLSRYLGSWHQDFYGGPQVRAFEEAWAAHFGVKHAIAVNSATSGLYAAVGAAGIEPGDEIIVTPFSMSASAVAPLVYNAIPVFADIEKDYFCLDVASIEQRITSRTKAIIIVDLFGLPYDTQAVNELARKHKLLVIEDCAQAPGAFYKNKSAGTLGDMGVYSLNYHKHIHTGEGGVVVTDNDELAERLRLIRNHAEAVIDAKGDAHFTNMIGFNYRLTEMQAAIGLVLVKHLNPLVEARVENVHYLEKRLTSIPALTMPKIRKDCTHAYYLHAIKFDECVAGVSRNAFVNAVKAELEVTEWRETEGVKVNAGYVKPLYLQSIYQKKQVYGTSSYPWSLQPKGTETSYAPGICPVTERMHNNELIVHELMRSGMTKQDLDDVFHAFEKVWENRKLL
ncbi:DegT/DnrJ/EryC1/StrS family aminotransferase [Candidatus Babeliales bacterium]|nr:DegT/DnrJ/EryC1/StrS family aminotransferase [Candidatus Babeliales bacterium]